MATSDTQIAVSKEIRAVLHDQKAPGDSYDTVIRRLLNGDDEIDVSTS